MLETPKPPRVIGDRTNMAAAAAVVADKAPDAIEFPKPIINDVDDALEDVSARLERLQILVDCNTSDLAELLSRNLPKHLQRSMFRVWTIYVTAAEKLAEIDTIVSAIVDAAHPAGQAVQA